MNWVSIMICGLCNNTGKQKSTKLVCRLRANLFIHSEGLRVWQNIINILVLSSHGVLFILFWNHFFLTCTYCYGMKDRWIIYCIGKSRLLYLITSLDIRIFYWPPQSTCRINQWMLVSFSQTNLIPHPGIYNTKWVSNQVWLKMLMLILLAHRGRSLRTC